ncbi:putative glycerol kinase [Rosa chinensis]|uniref:Putative glycerol kinase n=1 Tax=Rosa chinensis TaxID=74649 RepID=A0A2P6RVX6_ROSCH|nr:putative glycerol kinase [Rosa chinensis]
MTRFTNKAHLAQAVLESMCFQVNDVVDSMHKDAGEKGEVKNEMGEFLLRVDGGATVNNLLMQIQLAICSFRMRMSCQTLVKFQSSVC